MKATRVITLFRKLQIDMTFLSNGVSQTIVVKRALRVSPFYYYWLGLRLHNRDIVTPNGGTFLIDCIPTLPSGQDPQEFTSTATPALRVTIDGTSSTPAPPSLF